MEDFSAQGEDLEVLDAVEQHAAGAVVGSALVEVLEKGEDPAAFLESLRGA